MLSSFLYDVSVADPAIYLGGACLLLAVGVAAAWSPARRAVAVEPSVTLRAQ